MERLSEPDYVVPIALGSNHSRGTAIDVTLIDENGHPLDMGTAFDEMDDLSPLSPGTSQAAQRNRLLLNAIMFGGGFKGISTEWWHFELPDAAGYPLLDDVFACLSPLTLTESFHEYESHLFYRFRPRCWPLRWQRLSPAYAAVPKDMLVIGKAADPQTLDPAVTIDNNDWTVTYPAYQRLVKYKTQDGKGSTDVEGDPAESWQVSDDGKTDLFTAQNMQFDDGTPVTAEAVKLSSNV